MNTHCKFFRIIEFQIFFFFTVSYHRSNEVVYIMQLLQQSPTFGVQRKQLHKKEEKTLSMHAQYRPIFQDDLLCSARWTLADQTSIELKMRLRYFPCYFLVFPMIAFSTG